MKKYLILSLLLVFLLITNVWSADFSFNGKIHSQPQLDITLSNPNIVEIAIEIPSISLEEVETKAGTYSLITLPNYGYTAEIGKPKLPVIRKMVQIPYGADVEVELVYSEIKEYELSELDIKFPIIPKQPSIPKIEGALENAKFIIDETAYNTNKYSEFSIIKAENKGIIRGRRFVDLEISPIIYNPLNNTIKVYTNLFIRLNLIGSDMGKTINQLNHYYSPEFDHVTTKSLINDEYYTNYIKELHTLPIGYLIITPESYETSIANLAEWKAKKGYNVTVADLTNDVQGTTANDILSYIQNAYDTWTIPPTYVLLVGDVADVPSCVCNYGSDATDLYYGTMEGGDILPDISVGRFPVQNTTQASLMANRVVDYETMNGFDGTASWISNCIFIAGLDHQEMLEGTHNTMIDTYMIPNGYTTCHKDYEGTYGATTQDVSDHINAGAGWVNYSEHGSTTSWGSPYGGYGISDIDGLTNVGMYPFVISNACLTGSYQIDDCFGEHWVRQTDKGAIGFLGAAESSFWDEDDQYQPDLYRSIFDDAFYGLADFNNRAKERTRIHFGETSAVLYYYEIYNILGDPSLNIWMGSIGSMDISHNPICPISASSFTVNVDVDDALVACYIDDMLVGSAYSIGGSAIVTLDPAPSVEGIMHLTVTKWKYEPYITTLNILTPATVIIDPTSVSVNTPTNVQITVNEAKAPIENCVIRITGYGVGDDLIDTTDASGIANIEVNAIYGETLRVIGRVIGDDYDLFDEPLPVTDASDFASADLTVEVSSIGLTGELAANIEGTINGTCSEADFTIYALGCGLDESITANTFNVTPSEDGIITTTIGKSGFNIYQEDFNVILAYGTLAGYVYCNAHPIADASIKGYNDGDNPDTETPLFSLITDSTGAYTVPDSLPVGPYDIYVSKFGYIDYYEDYSLLYGANDHDINITLAPIGTLYGFVTEQTTAIPLNATITIYKNDETVVYETVNTNPATGRYEINLPYYTYDVKVEAEYHIPTSEEDITIMGTVTRMYELEAIGGGGGGNVLIINDNLAKSATIFNDILSGLGYTITAETSSLTDTSSWTDYDFIVWSSANNTNTIAEDRWQLGLINYISKGGRLLIEGGEIGYDAGSIYSDFRPEIETDVLHITDWNQDSSGDLHLNQPTHPLATTPNTLPTDILHTYESWGDQDGLVVDIYADAIFTWTSNSDAALIVYDDDDITPDVGQIVFYCFNLYNLDNSANARDYLIENSANYLSPTTVTYLGNGITHSDSAIVDEDDYYINYIPEDATTLTIEVNASFKSATYNVYVKYGEKPNETTYDFCDTTSSGSVIITIDGTTTPALQDGAYYIMVKGVTSGNYDITATNNGTTDITLNSFTAETRENSIMLSWEVEEEVSGYNLLRSINREDNYSNINSNLLTVNTYKDTQVEMATIYYYKLEVIDRDGMSIVFGPILASIKNVPNQFALRQNYPNPFNPETTIRFDLPTAAPVKLNIYNAKGQLVRTLVNEKMESGYHNICWDGTDETGYPVASGVYFYRINADKFNASKKMVMLK